MFGKKAKWKAEYENSLYKVYDWDGHLAGYFFPHYGKTEPEEEEDQVIEEMNRVHAEISEATLLLPMVKLGLLDNQEGMDIDYVIASLEANASRVHGWKDWLGRNAKSFGIYGARSHTAREDRNMLSVALGIRSKFALGDKEVAEALMPLLDKLHADGLL